MNIAAVLYVKYHNCDGVVIASVDFTDPAVSRLVMSDIPTVTLDYVFDSHAAIVSDNVGGMTAPIDYVYGMRHRKIAFIHGEMTSVTQKRLASFRKACAANALTIPESYIQPAIYHDPPEIVTGEYEDCNTDERFFAAASLHAATGESDYAQDAHSCLLHAISRFPTVFPVLY